MSEPMDRQPVDRQSMDVDIVCVGFGPATAGFLATLSRAAGEPGWHARRREPAIPGCRSRWCATSAPTISASASRAW